MDDIGLIIGFVFTLMIFSYLLGDNFLYRLAVYVFVGFTAGFITIVTVESVIIPWFNTTLFSGEAPRIGLGFIPIVIALLLLFKTTQRLGRLGNYGMALIIGVGTAVALVSALVGTIIPFILDTVDIQTQTLPNAIILFVGVACSLVYFQYTARQKPTGEIVRARPIQLFSLVGQGFIVVTLGAMYATAILTSLTIFTDRIQYLLAPIFGG
ncbi:MAG: hypothetical protein KJ043_04330 [Anaerolineae bacterium]|nr:hypothetical protein [Anaerolineae bacterium]